MKIVVMRDGRELEPWALQAGDLVIATEYNAQERKLTIWTEGSGRVPPSADVSQELHRLR